MAEQGRMGRLFETFDRLSTREKMLVGGLISALLITAAVVVWLVIGRQISNLEERNKGLRETLTQVNEQKTDYLTRKRRLDAYQRRLEQNDVKLVRLMESQATKLGITIEDFKENKRFITEKHKKLKKTQSRTKVKDLVEESQTVTMRRISLEQLTRFLAALESRQEPIKVTQLKIDTLSSDRQVLRQVQLTVSTYRNEEVDLL
ncbi:MAG: hypothetical protein KC549_01435 [Myxococcales bacterium]|nr:hypothetical protein [Myxococcales bacterium]MCB9545376.1 hypothetical protein [Myxococcales bacterium]